MRMMQEEKEGFLCNYCGKSVSLRISGNWHYHVTHNHGLETHVGPEPYDPHRRSRAFAITYGGFALVTAFCEAVVFLVELNSVTGPALIGFSIGSFVAPGCLAERYARKGEESPADIFGDLLVHCDICGVKMPCRERELHHELNHPDEAIVEKKIYRPALLVILALFLTGPVGAYIVLFLGEAGYISILEAIVLFVVCVACCALGLAIAYSFKSRYQDPRVAKLAREWSDRRGKVEKQN